MMYKFISLTALFAILLAAAGCGQKGDLYLPEPSAAPPAAAPVDTSTQSQDEDRDEDDDGPAAA